MKFAIIVVGMVALAILMAGCTSQDSNVNSVTNTAAPITTDTSIVTATTVPTENINVAVDKPTFVNTVTPVYVDLKVNPHPTDTVIEGCKVIAYIDSEGRVQMRNSPENPEGCPIDIAGRK